MASSAHDQPQPFSNLHSATAAPPPTPSALPNTHLPMSSSASAADDLSRLLHRLPPTLSLPTRRPSPPTTPPLIPLSDPKYSLDLFLSTASQLGFFQLTHHGLPSQLANSAESEALSLFQLSDDQKRTCFPSNWPLGFDDDEGNGESFWLDAACSTESTELGLDSLRGLARGLEKVGLEIVNMLSRAVGFDDPLKNDPDRFCSLMRVHAGLPGDKTVTSGGSYPYIVGLEYQIRSRKYSLLADSGWVTVLPQADSVMVTIGDIAQVWSNGKLKKVRGIPMACDDGDGNNGGCISMSLLLTLPTQSTVSPLLSKSVIDVASGNANEITTREDEDYGTGGVGNKDQRFRSFSFEDYAWTVFHQPLHFKDPLHNFRI